MSILLFPFNNYLIFQRILNQCFALKLALQNLLSEYPRWSVYLESSYPTCSIARTYSVLEIQWPSLLASFNCNWRQLWESYLWLLIQTLLRLIYHHYLDLMLLTYTNSLSILFWSVWLKVKRTIIPASSSHESYGIDDWYFRMHGIDNRVYSSMSATSVKIYWWDQLERIQKNFFHPSINKLLKLIERDEPKEAAPETKKVWSNYRRAAAHAREIKRAQIFSALRLSPKMSYSTREYRQI